MILAGILAPLLLALAGDDPEPRFEEREPEFVVREIEGWGVWINAGALAEHPEEMAAALEHLRHQLYAVTLVLPEATLDDARAVPIWVEYETATLCMSFHPARAWLTERGYRPPELESMIELANARTFLAWTKPQPWMVLHELAHGFDFLTLGGGERYGDGRAENVWRRAMKSGAWEEVLDGRGDLVRHYAGNNPMEHFAEATEAYFGINDFYPFVRAELVEHDAKTAELVETLWEVDVAARKRQERALVAALEAPPRETDGAVPSGVSYVEIEIASRCVRLHPTVAGDDELVVAVRAALAHELHLVDRLLPEAARTELADVTIRVEHDDPSLPYVACHGGAEIVLGHARAFVAGKRFEPCILIHGFGLAWFDRWSEGAVEGRHFSVDPGAFSAAWDRIGEGNTYDSVLRFDGRRVPHPGLRDVRTLFAELSETIFLANDHFPYLRAELKNHDPDTLALVESLWEFDAR